MPDSDETRLLAAIAAVQNGQSQRAAASFYQVAQSTLSRRLHGGSTRRQAQAKNRTLSADLESYLVATLLDFEKAGKSYHRGEIQQLAECLLRAQGRPQTLGKHWVSRFLQRNPQLKTKSQMAHEANRAATSGAAAMDGGPPMPDQHPSMSAELENEHQWYDPAILQDSMPGNLPERLPEISHEILRQEIPQERIQERPQERPRARSQNTSTQSRTQEKSFTRDETTFVQKANELIDMLTAQLILTKRQRDSFEAVIDELRSVARVDKDPQPAASPNTPEAAYRARIEARQQEQRWARDHVAEFEQQREIIQQTAFEDMCSEFHVEDL